MSPWAAARLLGLTCLVALSVWVGFAVPAHTYQKAMLAALVLVAGLLAVSVQSGYQFLGLAVLVVTAVAAPYQFGDSARAPLNIVFILAAFIAGMWTVSVALRRRTEVLESSRLVLAALAFAACAVGSFAYAQFPLRHTMSAPIGAQAAQLMIIGLSVGLFLIVPDLIGDVARLKRLAWLFVGAGAVVLVGAELGGRILGGPFQQVARMAHTETIGSVCWTWLVAISLSQALFNRGMGTMSRLMLASITALALFRGLVLARAWVSGWLPPLIVVLVLLLFRVPRMAVITGALAALTFLYFAPGMTSITPEQEGYSAMTRMEAARVLWPLIKANPLLGLGPANYYHEVSTRPILGWYVRFNSHNQYLDLAAQLGFVGVALFGWLMYEMASAAWSLRRHFHRDFGEAYILGALAGLAGTIASGMLADWILPFYYNIGVGGLRSSLLFWIFIGGVGVLTRLSRETAARAQAC